MFAFERSPAGLALGHGIAAVQLIATYQLTNAGAASERRPAEHGYGRREPEGPEQMCIRELNSTRR